MIEIGHKRYTLKTQTVSLINKNTSLVVIQYSLIHSTIVNETNPSFQIQPCICVVTKKTGLKKEKMLTMSDEMSPTKMILFILYAVALAMGVAAIILPLLGQVVDMTLIGIAIFCLGLAGMNQVTKE